ncbi:DUF2946 family protein [Parvularcula sp. LCG005]|uniref:DUF2946 family protein n=1 Tax=Parvularcula sp. LCG005 TaxID=3078805 RepID=UPI0029437FCA|nr:DUF2946 family protein [Parvularcula sp. LCG005]WOI52985.1 DUF2946 family protein [Parvularcula sp. LCG005]
MSVLSPPKLLRFWAMVVIAITVVIAPAAAELHVDLGKEATCESTAEHASSEAPGEDKSEHKQHHAHHCGGCHFHVLSPNLNGGDTSIYAAALAPFMSDLGPGLPKPEGPFRPPRS